MKSILSKRLMKQQPVKSLQQQQQQPVDTDNVQQSKQQPPQQVTCVLASSSSSKSNNSNIGIHEISTHSIIQTSALLHALNNNGAFVITPTSSNGSSDYKNNCNTNSTVISPDTNNTSTNTTTRVVSNIGSFDENDSNDSDSDTTASDIDDDDDEYNDLIRDDSDDDDDECNFDSINNSSNYIPSNMTTTTTKTQKIKKNKPVTKDDTANNNNNNNNSEISNLFLNHDIVLDDEHSIRVESPIYEPKEVRFSNTACINTGTGTDTIFVPSLSLDDDNVDHVGFDDDADGNIIGSIHHHQLRMEQERETTILHEQLRNALSNLSIEKHVRMKKERLIIKLAKEIQKRKYDISSYERKCIQLTSIINQLQMNLISTQQLLEQEQKLVNNQNNNTSSTNDVPTDEHERDQQVELLQIMNNNVESDDMTSPIIDDHDDDDTKLCDEEKKDIINLEDRSKDLELDQLRIDVMNLQLQIQLLQKEKDSLLILLEKQQQVHEQHKQTRTNIVLSKYKEIMETSSVSSSKLLHRMMWTVLCFLVVFKIVLLSSTTSSPIVPRTIKSNHNIQALVKNILCSPIRPGTKLFPNSNNNNNNDNNGHVSTYDAPWWVPPKNNWKMVVHNAICSNHNKVERTKIVWKNDSGQLMIYHILDDSSNTDTNQNNNNNNKLVFQGRGPMGVLFDVWDGSIHLLQQQQYNNPKIYNNNNKHCDCISDDRYTRNHSKKSSIYVPAPWMNN